MTYLSGLGSYIFTLGSVIIPFVIRETKKEESEFIDTLTRDVVNFNLSYFLYTILIKLLVVPLFIGSFFENGFIKEYAFHFEGDFDNKQIFGLISLGSLLAILAIVKVILIIQAIIKTNNGDSFNYPLTINFIS